MVLAKGFELAIVVAIDDDVVISVDMDATVIRIAMRTCATCIPLLLLLVVLVSVVSAIGIW
jgi:hypothetical protein